MKNISYILLITVCFLFNSCKETFANEEDVQMITPEEVESLSKMDEVQTLDVLTSKEYKEEHLKNAQNIVYDENFSHKIQEIDKSKPIIVYCNTKVENEKSIQILKDSGFVKVYDLKEGISEWKLKENKTEK
ncbi:Rhodanese-related sulfurtransferase [Mesonia phycicola]|uniref:Rhodanese-related sulfurtransferase n=1 Tax=Mesonia phycicola TaxID=579105 RepID=A0A1M6ACQ4_9FLAO|nr:rhodanese-like domain-containing protein [Mesonia phycicola]SHI34304.1 Rhodanese-related sulfurtransferase [Mesonia phycicola]